MDAIVLWAFLAVVNVNGLTGGAAPTQGECEALVNETVAIHDVLVLSECQPVTLQPVKK